MSTADDAFAAGCEDGSEMPADEETARAIARACASDLKNQDGDKDDAA